VTTQDLKARKNRLKEESREDKKEVIKNKENLWYKQKHAKRGATGKQIFR
jgi:hypothetical protein